MNLLIVAHAYPPSGTVGSVRPAKWAKYLPEDGWCVDVLTASTSAQDETNGVSPHGTVYRVPDLFHTKFDSSHAGLRWTPRLLQVASKLSLTDSYDAVIISGGPFIPFSVTPALKHVLGAAVVLDFRDPWTLKRRGMKDDFSSSGGVASALFNYGSTVAERLAINSAAACLTPVPELTERYQSHYPESRFETIYNGYDPDDYPRHDVDRKNQIVYAGKFYGAIRNFFAAVEDDAPQLVYFGDDERFVKVGSEFGLHIDDRGYQPISVIAREIQASKAGLAASPDPAAIPQKCFDYLACGTPIIGIDPADGALSRLVDETIGACSSSTDLQEIRNVIDEVLSGITTNTRETKYSRVEQASKLNDLLREIAN
ncbi:MULTISPECIES: glycosyltransferase [Haloferax]|uniref:glycosyltransferase n=1 Tax=Haloferax TaxID=2251 RepID=UPI000E24C2CF|nr:MULTISPECIES: glycosyltransferase [Haloferax]RDZ38990.1 hypothetical protein C5B89_10610 [Haloferax sp. Atlit-47N]WEL30231.1 Glycosyltransferase [Haloferax alexandrinus]